MMDSIQHIVGVDVSQQKWDIAYLKDIRKRSIRSKILDNNPDGCLKFIEWIEKNITTDLSTVHVIMEATGVYHELLAYFLHDKGIKVSIVNPKYILDFAKSLGTVHKTDKSDSKVIALYGATPTIDIELWQPEPLHIRQLKAKLARLDALKADLQRENNRLHSAQIANTPEKVLLSLNQMIAALEQNIADLQNDVDNHIDQHPDLKHDIKLLQSIPAVGKETSLYMAVLYRSRQFTSAAQMAAFLGLIPKERQSGKYKGKVMLSKRGSSKIRALLYMPAIIAKRYNPDIQAHYERLLARGKTKMQAIGASMRRLVHICFGVLKHQTVYQAQTV